MTVAHWPGSVKPCPTCGREISGTADQCETCEVWASALVDAPPPGDAVKNGLVDDADALPLASAPPPPASAAPEPVSTKAAASRRGLTLGIAGTAAVVVLGIGIMSFGAARNAARAADAAPPPAVTARAPVASAPNVPGATASTGQTWNTDKQATWLGGRRRGAAFELPADNVVKTWFGPARPSLIVRCISHNVEAFVFTGSPMKIETRAAGKTVNLSLDDEAMRTERWPDSDDHDALFAPDGAAFTSRLFTARTLRFGYSPHNSPEVVAQFHVGGLEALMKGASKECAAKPPAR